MRASKWVSGTWHPALRVVLIFLAVVTLSASRPARGDDAKPVRFWYTTFDGAMKPAGRGAFSQAVAIQTPLVGWSCRTTDIRQDSRGDFGVVQSANLICSTSTGSVDVGVMCKLTSDDVFETDSMFVKDGAGHAIHLVISCANHQPH